MVRVSGFMRQFTFSAYIMMQGPPFCGGPCVHLGGDINMPMHPFVVRRPERHGNAARWRFRGLVRW